jgi:hypothetical protein
VFVRQSESGLSSLTYFVAKDVSFIPLMMLYSLVFATVSWTISFFQAPFWEFARVVFLEFWMALSVGYLASIPIKRRENSQVACLSIVITLLIFSGSLLSLNDMKNIGFPLSWIPDYSFQRYGLESLYLSELKEYSKIYDVEISQKSSGLQ